MDWDLLSFIKRSEQRVKILEAFTFAKTPTELAKTTKLSPSHISRTLKEFTEKGIVKCQTPDKKLGRIYTLTESGEQLVSAIKGGEILKELKV